MGYDAKLDSEKTRHWAITPLLSAGAIVNYTPFELVNRATGRAHLLHFVGGGLSFSLGGGGTGPNVTYELFTTPKAMCFSDFDKSGARVTSVNAGLFWGYSHTWLTIWSSAAYLSPTVAYVSVSGWGPMLPGGNGAVHGVLSLSYGSGAMSGVVPMVLEIPESFAPSPRLVSIQTKARETSLMSFPGDVLFAFDSDKLQPAARIQLQNAIDIINSRDRGKISIEGHTDSKGKEAYNKQLSKRRAEAVKRFLVTKKVFNANSFQVVGHGAKKPIAPNEFPGGRDNPAGRAKNRRVDILFGR